MIYDIECLKKITTTIEKKNQKNTELVAFIEDVCHTKLLQHSANIQELEELREELNYTELISKLQSIMECLEGGYYRILDKIEGKN